MTKYPTGTISELLKTDQVTEPTRQALTERFNAPHRLEPTFFTVDEYDLLRIICDRLIPQTDQIDLVGAVDERLAANKTNGWRYDTMPADGEAYRLGLKGMDESAQLLFGNPFRHIPDEQQDEVIRAVQRAEAPGNVWQTLPADHFFEELLAEIVEIYYSHPQAQEAIGYVGMADVPTWQRIGLNQLEDREPRAINKAN